jgi:hypothetical protein
MWIICGSYDPDQRRKSRNNQTYSSRRSLGSTVNYDDTTQGHKGDRILPPTDPNSKTWMPPEHVTIVGCIKCHDADPFIVTPYVKDTKVVPVAPERDPFGPYQIVSTPGSFEKAEDYYALQWRRRYSLTDESVSACTQCHRIGYPMGCSYFTSSATGHEMPSSFNDECKEVQREWMPPNHGKYTNDEASKIKKIADRIQFCCERLTKYGPVGAAPCQWQIIEGADQREALRHQLTVWKENVDVQKVMIRARVLSALDSVTSKLNSAVQSLTPHNSESEKQRTHESNN